MAPFRRFASYGGDVSKFSIEKAKSNSIVREDSNSGLENKVWVQKSALAQEKPPFRRHSSAVINSNSDAQSEVSTSSSGNHSLSNLRQCSWSWKKAMIVLHDSQKLVVRLQDEEGDTDSLEYTLAPTALQEGLVVLRNEFPLHEGEERPPSDLITLTHLHEPAVVTCLQIRYRQDAIYTNTGPHVLLALNPFRTIRGLYGEAVMKQYWENQADNKKSAPPPPHVYQIAHGAFASMMRQLDVTGTGTEEHQEENSPANQSILISGESGAGKTVSTKLVMKFLAALSQKTCKEQSSTPERAYAKAKEKTKNEEAPGRTTNKSRTSFKNPSWALPRMRKDDSRMSSQSVDSLTGTKVKRDTIEAQVLQSNPILESFGNARTVRNDNSSRFGKFIELQFSERGQLVGAQMETYLLEKVRLFHQNAGERSFHVFYELLSGGMHPNALAQLYLAPTAHPSDFKLCSGSAEYGRRDGVQDKDTFSGLLQAFETLQFEAEELQEIWSVTAALLHASNLSFVDEDENSCQVDASNVHFRPVCHLLGVTQEALKEALVQQKIRAGGQTVTKSLSADQAHRVLLALSKATYGALFDYLVARINESIIGTKPVAATIGVLDIFGFESFPTNSFEQLCINYANEALQQQFNKFVLRNEQQLYTKEGIEWSFIEFPENQDVIDLLEQRGGILKILDDQCRAPGPSDKAFYLSALQTCGKHKRFEANRRAQAHYEFCIRHYAGPVTYSTTGFIAKNRDELPVEATELLIGSESGFVQELGQMLLLPSAKQEETTTKTFRKKDLGLGRPTLGGQFQRQLKRLRGKIEHTSPQYIRCLKPNDLNVPDQFDSAIIAQQLSCGGILEAVRVARAGFCQHYVHAEFCARYRSLCWRECSGASSSLPVSPTAVMHVKSAYWNRSGSNSQNTPKKADHKSLCRDLMKILYRKLQQYYKEQEIVPPPSPTETPKPPSPQVTKPPSPQVTPTTGVHARYNPRLSVETTAPRNSTGTAATTRASGWKRGGVTNADFAKLGMQLGKTKVFLRHSAFEALERIRSREQAFAATKLNSIFRMYLARLAWLPYRHAFRQAARFNDPHDEFKETKEAEYNDHIMAFRKSLCYGIDGYSLVDKWATTKLRDAIHNPVPRSQWGQDAPSHEFQWALRDGLWVKNFH